MNDADHLSYLGTSDADLFAAWERAVREEAEARSRKERHLHRSFRALSHGRHRQRLCGGF